MVLNPMTVVFIKEKTETQTLTQTDTQTKNAV